MEEDGSLNGLTIRAPIGAKNIFCFSSRNLFAGTLENAQTERSATEQNSGKNSSNPAF